MKITTRRARISLLALSAAALAGACITKGEFTLSPPCSRDTDCGDGGLCVTSARCVNHECVTTYAPAGTPAPDGECQKQQCDGDGGIIPGAPFNADATCSTGVCDGAGQCVQCVTDMECGDAGPCASMICENHKCSMDMADAGTSCGTDEACDGQGECLAAQCSHNFDCMSNICEGCVSCGSGCSGCMGRCTVACVPQSAHCPLGTQCMNGQCK